MQDIRLGEIYDISVVVKYVTSDVRKYAMYL